MCLSECFIAKLIVFLSLGSLASVKAILEIAGKDSLEHRDSQNRTPLHVATMGGHGEVVNFLLSQEGSFRV